MSQQQSPWIESAYGWQYGESGWNSGMDTNLLKFSFLFDGNIDGIVSSLPSAVNGSSYFLTTDNRFYFALGATYYSSPCPKNFIFKIKSTGDFYKFNGTTHAQIDSPEQIESRISDIELTLSQLGTAAFEDISFFSTKAQLDVVEAQSQDYTDSLRSDLSDLSGSSLVGWQRTALTSQINTVASAINSQKINVWEFADLIVDKPTPSDPSTWDWYPAIQAAINYANSVKIDIQVSSIPEIGSRTISQPTVYLPATNIYRIRQSLLIYQETGSWTSFSMCGEEGLGTFIIADDGLGGVSNLFDIIRGVNPSTFPGFQTYIGNIHFVGGRRHLTIQSANIDNRNIKIENCSHHSSDPTEYAIYIDARSTLLKISEARVVRCPKFLYIKNVDRAVLEDSWIDGYKSATEGKPTDTSSISINGLIQNGPSRLCIRGCMFIPEPNGITQNPLTRWIDLNDDCSLEIRDTQFGLENAGYPIVYVNTPLNSVNAVPYHSDARIVMDGIVGGAGASSRDDRGVVVFRKGIPHIISLRSISRVAGGIIINSDKMIDGAGSPITVETYLSSIASPTRPMISITVEDVMGWDTKKINRTLSKFVSGNIPVISPAGTYKSSTIQPSGRLNGWLTPQVLNDSTITIDLPSQFGVAIITADDSGITSTSNRVGSTVGLEFSSQAASAASFVLWDGQYGNMVAANTDLTGTTGAIGNFTISVKNGALMEIENRLGFTCQFRVLFLNTHEY